MTIEDKHKLVIGIVLVTSIMYAFCITVVGNAYKKLILTVVKSQVKGPEEFASKYIQVLNVAYILLIAGLGVLLNSVCSKYFSTGITAINKNELVIRGYFLYNMLGGLIVVSLAIIRGNTWVQMIKDNKVLGYYLLDLVMVIGVLIHITY